jgi:hypothetical protein
MQALRRGVPYVANMLSFGWYSQLLAGTLVRTNVYCDLSKYVVTYF